MIYRNNWIKSIIINLVILAAVMLWTNLSYDTNDDYAIASRIAAGDPYVDYIAYWLCWLLVRLQTLLPMVNAYVLAQIVLSYVSFVCILKLLIDGDRSRTFCIVSTLILALFSFDHYSMLQFTKTSAVLLCAGMLLLIDAMTRRRCAVYYILGLLFLYLGAALRIKNTPVMIGFAGLFLILWVIENHTRLKPEGYLKPGRLVLYALLLILIGGVGASMVLSEQINRSTPELRAYQEYNNERSDVIDYSQYRYYDEYAEDFDALDLSKNDLYLINNWYFDYNGAASLENLKAINKVYDQARAENGMTPEKALRAFLKSLRSDLRKHTQSGIHIVLLLGIALAALIRMKPKYWLYILAVGVSTIGIYLALYYMGRPAYRAMYTADLGAAVWLLYAMDRSRCWGGGRDPQDAHPAVRGLRVVLCVFLCAAMAGGIFLEYGHSASSFESISHRIRPDALAARIKDDPDHMYVFSTREKNYPESYLHPLMVPDPDANTTTFGGWGTCSPYLLNRLASYDLDNLFGDIIDNPSVYVIEKKNVGKLETYFNKWYAASASDRRIAFRPAGTVDGYQIWQVVRTAEN